MSSLPNAAARPCAPAARPPGPSFSLGGAQLRRALRLHPALGRGSSCPLGRRSLRAAVCAKRATARLSNIRLRRRSVRVPSSCGTRARSGH
eukprot:688061-Prymnesium_polylepis.2